MVKLICFIASLAILMNCTAISSDDLFREILEPEIFAAHGLLVDGSSSSVINAATNKIELESAAHLYYCGPLSDLRRKMAEVSKLSTTETEQSHVVYLKKSKGRACFACLLSKDAITNEMEMKSNSTWSMDYLPMALKIHSSVLQYLSFISRTQSPDAEVELVSKHKRRQSREDRIQNKPAPSINEEISHAGIREVLRSIIPRPANF
jgi:hypothetical protein